MRDGKTSSVKVRLRGEFWLLEEKYWPARKKSVQAS
jgi:hypothetical protein